jgi:hypothetical protein
MPCAIDVSHVAHVTHASVSLYDFIPICGLRPLCAPFTEDVCQCRGGLISGQGGHTAGELCLALQCAAGVREVPAPTQDNQGQRSAACDEHSRQASKQRLLESADDALPCLHRISSKDHGLQTQTTASSESLVARVVIIVDNNQQCATYSTM